MRIDRGFLSAYVNRFEPEITDDWFRSRLMCSVASASGQSDDPAMLLRELQLDLEKVYVATSEGIRIGSWIYKIARGFIAHRYQSTEEFVDICMAPASTLQSLKGLKYVSLDPEAVPIYAVDGVPGLGKSALARSLERVFPPPIEITAEGNPPQRIGAISALWIRVNKDFSLSKWVKGTLDQLAVEKQGAKTLDELSMRLFKGLYRVGVGVILVDELQFASGRTSVRRAIGQLLSMRNFGVPIVFFANTDFIQEIQQSPAQIAQRIPRERKTFSPILRTDPIFKEILDIQLGLVSYGHEIDTARFAKDIYDLVGGLPRGSARLIELAAAVSVAEHRKLNFHDIVVAEKSPSFDAMREHIAILRGSVPIDKKKYPELASNSDDFDPAAAYRRQMQDDRIADAAAQSLYSSYSDEEKERANAIAVELLRRAGKLDQNISALGESKVKRASKKTLEERVIDSYAAKHLAKFTPKNRTSKDGSD